MKLFLCEKPSQGRDIAKVLGATKRADGYISNSSGSIVVTWAIGHLLEQLSPEDYSEAFKDWKLDTLPIVPEQWKMKPVGRTKDQYKTIQILLKKADEVVIATDADREGEVIGVEILEFNKYKGKRSRLWLSALDEKSIKKALDDIRPADKTYPLYEAGLGRQRADWLYGMSITRGLTIVNRGRIQGVMNAGRVQTPTLKLVVDRDDEIENFKPTDYFDVELLFSHQNGDYVGKLVPTEDMLTNDYLVDKTIAQSVIDKALEAKSGEIKAYKKQQKKKAPPLGYSLSQLQKECSSHFGYSATDTLKYAQALYEEHKALTYPRSDCQYLPEEQEAEIQDVLDAVFASNSNDQQVMSVQAKINPSARTGIWNTKKVTAHHAIIPTQAKVNPEKFSEAERNVYKLVRNNYLMQFLGDYVYDSTSITTESAGYKFESKGAVPKELGWREIMKKSTSKKADDEDVSLPSAEKGDNVDVKKADIKAKQTKPRPRFTEGTLIEAMKKIASFVTDPELKKVLRETSGIGTEATRANIIEKLFATGYLEKEGKKAIKSTAKGRAMISVAPQMLKNPETTSLWEQQLDDIAQGSSSLTKFLENQERYCRGIMNEIKSGAATIKESVASDFPCPKCGSALVRRQGTSKKSGKYDFWACSNYVEGSESNCGATFPNKRGKPDLTHTPKPKAELSEHDCPKCNSKLVKRNGKNGVFWGCSNWKPNGKDNCDAMFSDYEGKPDFEGKSKPKAQLSEHDCPKCNSKLVKRNGKNGVFWGCSNWKPNGKDNCNAMFSDKDGKPDLEGKKTAKAPVSKHKCPQCESPLSLRKGSKGHFYGCSTFPKCKFTANADGKGEPIFK